MHRGTDKADGSVLVFALIAIMLGDREIIKGKNIIDAARQKTLSKRLAEYDGHKSGPETPPVSFLRGGRRITRGSSEISADYRASFSGETSFRSPFCHRNARRGD